MLELLSGESVLECLERHGIAIRSSCRTGVCQSCLVRATEGPVSPIAQRPLGPGLVAQGYFLACQFRPDAFVACAAADDLLPPVTAEVQRLERLTDDVLALHLQVPESFRFRGGQFVHLERPDGLMRSYSIANLPGDGSGVELHVRRMPSGAMSGWIHDELKPGHRVTLRGPLGDCTYDSASPDEPLVLAGVGTGMAPLLAVAREAVARKHRAPIRVYQGGLHASRLYLMERFAEVVAQHHDARQVGCVLQGAEGEARASGLRRGHLADVVVHDLGEMVRRATIILCGDATVVSTLRKRLFLGGASMRRLHADAFVPATTMVQITRKGA